MILKAKKTLFFSGNQIIQNLFKAVSPIIPSSAKVSRSREIHLETSFPYPFPLEAVSIWLVNNVARTEGLISCGTCYETYG